MARTSLTKRQLDPWSFDGSPGDQHEEFLAKLTEHDTALDSLEGQGAFVDLSKAPYLVTATSSNPGLAARQANTTGINQAIVDHSGTGAVLLLPQGRIYIEEATGNHCIRFGTGINNLSFRGRGMFATRLVQFCVGDAGELNALVIDGAQRIELCDFGVEQEEIGTPDPGQQNHLICVYNNTLGGTTRDIVGHHLYFGKCIGDALRILAGNAADKVVNARFSHMVMHLNGVVTSSPPNGRTGARSGIALQRGAVDCEFSHFYVKGAQNSGIDEEPSGGTGQRTRIHHFFVDNTISNTGTAVSLGGTGSAVLSDAHVHHGHVLGGKVTMLGASSGYLVEDLVIETNEPMPADTAAPLFDIKSAGAGGGHVDLRLVNITVKRLGTSGAGRCIDIINKASLTTMRGIMVHQGTAADPVVVECNGRVSVDDYSLVYTGGTPASFRGLRVLPLSAGATLEDVQLSNLSFRSTTGKLAQAVHMTARTSRLVNRFGVLNSRSDGYATTGVYMTYQAGTMDLTPQLHGISNGTDTVWDQRDQGDNPVTTMFPIVAGNRGNLAFHVGAATPEGAVTAIQGSECVFRNGDSTAKYRKTTGTGNTGWVTP